MKVALGSDHAGFELKNLMLQEVAAGGHEPQDLGVYDPTPSDYPDISEKLALHLLAGNAERGILICGSGIGASVAANKIPGIRAGLSTETYSGHQGVEHDDMNILVMAARVTGVEVAKEIVRAFLGAKFSGEERHVRRLAKVKAIEERYMKSP